MWAAACSSKNSQRNKHLLRAMCIHSVASISLQRQQVWPNRVTVHNARACSWG